MSNNLKYTHVEISALDRHAAAKFYGGVFGWEFTDFPDSNYSSTRGTDEVTTGLNPVNEDNPAGNIIVYIETDNLDATMAKIKSMGGQIHGETLDIPGVGIMAYFSDPTGNKLALMQPVLQGGM